MNYTHEKLENSRVKITIDVNAEELDAAIEEAYQKNKGKFAVEGFRKGKVPRKYLENTYGKGVFFDDALDIILPKYYDEVLDKEKDIIPVGKPEADVLKFEEDCVQYSVTVTVRPEVKLAKYTGLKLKKEVVEVSDEQVEAELKLAQDKQARIAEITEDRESKLGDYVTIDFSGSVDGEKFEGGTAEKYDIEIGSNTFIPGFEEQLVGLKKGAETNVKVNFPDDYGAENLAGKEAVFAVKLHAIKSKELPELNDEFAKDISEFDTLAQYKEDIKKNLLKTAEERASVEEENQMMDAIVEKSEVYIPAEMVDYQSEDMLKEFEYRLMYQGMKMDDYLKFAKVTKEQIMADYREPAEKQVKTRLVMEEIIKNENIEPSEEEINAQIEKFAKESRKSVDEFKKTMNSNHFNYIVNQIVTDKLMALLKSKNNFS